MEQGPSWSPFEKGRSRSSSSTSVPRLRFEGNASPPPCSNGKLDFANDRDEIGRASSTLRKRIANRDMDHPRAFETRVFLPPSSLHEGNRIKSGIGGGGGLMGALVRFLRQRRCFTWLLLSAILASQIWFWTPVVLSEERIKELGIEKWRDTAIPWMPAPPAPAPPVEPPPVQLPSHGLPNMELPYGYGDPPDDETDQLSLSHDAFPAALMTGLQHASHDFDKLYLDGNPHAGVIPARKLQVLDREPVLYRPLEPLAAPQVPASLWVPHSGWSPSVNGSKTTYVDAYTPEAQPLEPEWRRQPFDGWQPPLEELRRSASRRMPLPKVQHHFTAPDTHSGVKGDRARDKLLQNRQRLVKNAFLHAWEGYKRLAWGHDELRPVSGVPQDNFNGWGATIVDALDTLLVMGLPGEYDLARQHVRDIDFHLLGGERSAYGNSDGKIPVFETAIRYLGGFLSAYDLSGDVLMRDRAEELAQLLMPAFDTPTGVPVGRIKFDQPSYKSASGGVILAEAASMLLEMTRLWQVTGNRTYFDRVQRTSDWLDRNMTNTPERLGALLPTSIFPERGTMYGWYTWGGMADSAFEYLIKEHQLLGGHLEQYGRMFGDVLDSAHRWLLRHVGSVPNAPLLIMGQSNGRLHTPKLEHLTCFAGGSIGLSAKLLPGRIHDLVHAERVTESCWWAYNATATGIGPEELTFYRERDTDRFENVIMPDGTSRRGNARGSPIIGVRSMQADYRNRPETIESVFYMWRITGDQKWQERGWQMFSSWVTHCMTDVGFSSIQSVLEVPSVQSDSMESFVFAETFKYYYLLFSPPSLISLDDYVFTTEAHPLLTPQKGRWARAGHGPKKLWDDKAPESSHLPPPGSGIYSGGEGGPVGGLTRQQKHAILKQWNDKNERERERQRKKQEALEKAKEIANKAALGAAHDDNVTTSNDGGRYDGLPSSNNFD